MKVTRFAVLMLCVSCAGPARQQLDGPHPPAPSSDVGRRCWDVKRDDKERCALADNPVEGRVEVLDMYHLRVGLKLARSVSGCGDLAFTTTLLVAGAPQPLAASFSCREECMPDGPGGGVCRHVAHDELTFDLEVEGALPFFRPDGTSEGGEISLTVTSAQGHLPPTTLVARKSAEPPRYSGDVAPRALDPCEEFNRNQSRLSEEEHTRQFGCPPCPCACVNGQITCAPCAACVPVAPPRPEPDR